MLSLIFGPDRRQAADAASRAFLSGDAYSDPVRAGFMSTGVGTRAGVAVDQDSALSYSPVWAASRILSETIGSSLDRITYERKGEDRERATNIPIYDLLKSAPNPTMGSEPAWEMAVLSQVNAGNAFMEIEFSRPGNYDSDIVALWPIHPSRVRPVTKRDTNRKGQSLLDLGYAYIVKNDGDEPDVALFAEEMLHIPGVFSDGIWGRGTIEYARESIGGGIATEQHGQGFFGSGAQPKGWIEGSNLKDPEARRTYREEWKEVHKPGSSEVALLPMGWKYNPIMLTNSDSQFVEAKGENVKDVARWYVLPAYRLGGEQPGTAVEQLAIEFVMYSILPWCKKIEGQCNLKLIRDRSRYYVEHNLNALLRGDFKARIEAYRLGIMCGMYNLNEVRRLENLPGIGPQGDVHFMPANLTTAERLMEGPEPVASPFGQPGSDHSGAPNDGIPGSEGPDQIDQTNGNSSQRFANRLTHHDRRMIDNHLREVERRALPAPAASDGQRAAAKQVLADAVRRWRTKESNAAKRESKRTDFPQWLASFHREHRATLEDMLTPAAAVLSSNGELTTANRLAGEVLAASAILSESFEHDTPSDFSKRLEDWPGYVERESKGGKFYEVERAP